MQLTPAVKSMGSSHNMHKYMRRYENHKSKIKYTVSELGKTIHCYALVLVIKSKNKKEERI